MTKDTWMKLSSTIKTPDGTVWQRVRVKEEDYVPEWAGLMTAKSEDPVVKAQLRAENMRKSRKQELVSKKRGLYGNKTPAERSVSPMFGTGTQDSAGDGSVYEIGVGAQEESKEVALRAATLSSPVDIPSPQMIAQPALNGSPPPQMVAQSPL